MIQRCTNPKNPQWRDYGARGISVCTQWRSFPGFLADMGEPPPGATIERIDNDRGYEPGNCRWATRAEQNRNTRRNHLVEHDGVRLTVGEWASRLGLKPSTLVQRLRRGWEVSRALRGPQGSAHRYG
jgi:hypothetical protein